MYCEHFHAIPTDKQAACLRRCHQIPLQLLPPAILHPFQRLDNITSPNDNLQQLTALHDLEYDRAEFHAVACLL